MKRKVLLLFISLAALLFLVPVSKANAQLYNPYYSMYYGYGYMPLATGYYVGQIYGGFPHGIGYVYYYDMNFGWIVYQGGFTVVSHMVMDNAFVVQDILPEFGTEVILFVRLM